MTDFNPTIPPDGRPLRVVATLGSQSITAYYTAHTAQQQAASGITNLRIVNKTHNTATVAFDISPVVDCTVELDDGNGYVSGANTGSFASHNYAIDSYFSLYALSDYTIRITPVGKSPETISFQTSAAPSAPVAGSWIEIQPSEWQAGNAQDKVTHSNDWSGVGGFQPDGGDKEAWRVRIGQGDHYGSSQYFESGIPYDAQEVELRYRVFLPADFETYWTNHGMNIKFPGITGVVAGGKNGGFGGGFYTHLDQQYRAFSGRLQMNRPNDGGFSRALGAEKYWMGSANGPHSAGQHGQPRYNGDSKWASPNSSASQAQKIVGGQWMNIYTRIKVNTPNVANGEYEFRIENVAGSGYSETGIEWMKPFSNWQQFMNEGKLDNWTRSTEMFQIDRVWMDFYYGGGTPKQAPGDLNIFTRKYEYRVLA